MTRPTATVSRGDRQCLSCPIPGAAWITASVGRGGANRRDDTKAVQAALNLVPASLGGAGESLDEDGLCGPLTVGAIDAFQRRWLTVRDGRCDPAGPTLGLINAMAGVGDALPCGAATAHSAAGGNPAVAALAPSAHGAESAGKGAKPNPNPKPKPTPPSAREKQDRQIFEAELRQHMIERHTLPHVHKLLLVMQRLVGAASLHLARLRGLHGAKLPADQRGSRERKAFLVVAKTFRLHEKRIDEADAALRFIDLIARRAQIVASQFLPREPRAAPAPHRTGPLFVSLFRQHARHGKKPSIAYVTQGGLHLKPGPSGYFNPAVNPGQVVPERTNRIYLQPLFDREPYGNRLLTVVHELAHFVGATEGPRSVPDHAYLDEKAKWKGLNAQQRLHTADSYGFLALELGVGTLDAIKDAGSDKKHIPIYPIVGNSAVGYGSEVYMAIPDAPDEHHEKFDYPAGAMF